MATLALSVLMHRPAPERRTPWPGAALALLRELVALIGARRLARDAPRIAPAAILEHPQPVPEGRARRSAGI